MDKILKYVKKNYALSICVGIFVLMFLVMIIFFIFKKGTFGIGNDNQIVIDCPSVFEAGETLECDVSLSMVDDYVVEAVKANFDLGNGVSYHSFGVDNTECSGEGCFEPLEISSSGFMVTNIDGFVVNGTVLIGKLTVTMPSNVEVGETYKIGLNEIEVVYEDPDDGEDKVLELDDASANPRTANNVATLSDITLSHGELNETFSSSLFKYTATVDSDVEQVDIDCVLTDENASVSGSGITLDLHYGKNTYYIEVVSEDGNVTNTYEITITRQYEFSSSVYVYNSIANYIYTGTDTGDAILANIDELGDNLQYVLEGNTLSVVYGEDDVLVSMDVINFDLDYEVINGEIHAESDLTYGGLLDKIDVNNVVIYLLDNEGNSVTDESTVIANNYQLKVYYDSTLLDTFTFVGDYLNITVGVADNQNMLIKKLPFGMTIDELAEGIDTSGTVSYLDADTGEEISTENVVSTNTLVVINFGDHTVNYALSVLGDIIGDGELKMNDIGRLYRYYRQKQSLTVAEAYAGDVIVDGEIKMNDIGRLYRYYRNKIDYLEEESE